MSVEFNIARRLSSRRNGLRAGVMERVATIATIISLAIIVVTLSVVEGFKRNIDTLLTGASSDIVVTAPESRGVVSSAVLPNSEAIETILNGSDMVASYSTYLAKAAVIKSDENIVGVMLKGVDSLYNMEFFKRHIIEGELPRFTGEPRSRDVIISRRIAESMDVGVGDRIEMVFVDSESGLLRDRFSISGIYETGLTGVDNTLVLSDVRNVKRFYDRSQEWVTGYEVWLTNEADSELVAEELNDKFVELYFETEINAEAFTIESIFPQLFSWLATHDVNALFITVIMIIVALLNMTTALLIIVLERQRMIGELRAMGMGRVGVVKIFVARALFIISRGVIIGTMLGVALCVVQHFFGVVPLPAEGYILSTVPAALCWGQWLVAIVATIVITLVMMILPSLLATKVSPSKAIRYE
ncbi:MAG: ABC transporter permease [Alistipes sp.]|nr:ABC transporter permease [Alistipes sp.]